jgi:hypothetical protein
LKRFTPTDCLISGYNCCFIMASKYVVVHLFMENSKIHTSFIKEHFRFLIINNILYRFLVYYKQLSICVFFMKSKYIILPRECHIACTDLVTPYNSILFYFCSWENNLNVSYTNYIF